MSCPQVRANKEMASFVAQVHPPSKKLLHINVQRFRGGLVFKAHRLCVSLNSRLESNKEEDALEQSFTVPTHFHLIYVLNCLVYVPV